jgi:hypothetical protein
LSRSSQHGVLHQILCGGEIAGHVDQRRDQSARVFAYHAGQLVVYRFGHVDSNSRSGEPRRPGSPARSWPHAVRRLPWWDALVGTSGTRATAAGALVCVAGIALLLLARNGLRDVAGWTELGCFLAAVGAARLSATGLNRPRDAIFRNGLPSAPVAPVLPTEQSDSATSCSSSGSDTEGKPL